MSNQLSPIPCLLKALSSSLPCFPIDQSSIEILESPAHFYETLLEEITNSHDKISISSLYLGTGELEQALVNQLHSRMASRVNLEAKILLDYHRAQRIDSLKSSSLTTLGKILGDDSFKSRFNLHLYRCPQYRLYHDLCLGMRWKEIIGVQHTKLYVFDDTIIVSGANLSHSYFVNRSDRYFKFKDSRLAEYAHSVVAKISDASYTYDFSLKSLRLPKNSLQANSFTFNKCYPLKSDDSSHRTWVFPAMQLGVAGIHQDESAIYTALKSLDSSDALLTFASGYLNITPQLQTFLLNLKGNVRILTASPSANGFYNAKGFARHIPNVYSSIQSQIIASRKQRGKMTMLEYNRPGWTYHEKGVWVQPSQDQSPILMTIGSSNFGYRSTTRDLECQFYLLSEDPLLHRRLGCELTASMKYMSPVTPDTFRIYPERRLSVGIRLVSRLIRTWL